MARDPGYPRTLPTPRTLPHGTPRRPPTGSTAGCTYGTPRRPPSGSKTGFALSPTPAQGGSDYSCSRQRFSHSPQVIFPLNSPQTSLQTLEYHSPLEGESQKPEPNGEGFCGGGFAQGEPTARSCAPSRVRTDQVTGDRRCPGGQCRPPVAATLPPGIELLRSSPLSPPPQGADPCNWHWIH